MSREETERLAAMLLNGPLALQRPDVGAEVLAGILGALLTTILKHEPARLPWAMTIVEGLQARSIAAPIATARQRLATDRKALRRRKGTRSAAMKLRKVSRSTSQK